MLRLRRYSPEKEKGLQGNMVFCVGRPSPAPPIGVFQMAFNLVGILLPSTSFVIPPFSDSSSVRTHHCFLAHPTDSQAHPTLQPDDDAFEIVALPISPLSALPPASRTPSRPLSSGNSFGIAHPRGGWALEVARGPKGSGKRSDPFLLGSFPPPLGFESADAPQRVVVTSD